MIMIEDVVVVRQLARIVEVVVVAIDLRHSNVIVTICRSDRNTTMVRNHHHAVHTQRLPYPISYWCAKSTMIR